MRALAIGILLFIGTASGLCAQAVPAAAGARSAVVPRAERRVLVTSDIGDDPDDTMSLIRFLSYSNELDVEGIIATTSVHQKNRVSPELIKEVLDAYSKVRPNLLLHDPGYPTFASLSLKVKAGLPVYGMEGVGEGKDSPGSDWIVKVLEKPDERPIWVCAWGGPSTLAQALWKIQHTRSAEETARLVRKLRVYTTSDQDDSGPWMRKTFPELFYIVSPGGNYMTATWIGITFPAPGSNAEVVSRPWLAKNIQQGHGPMGSLYPDIAYGMEGDTPTFLSLIPNGLSDPEHPDQGNWGGRYELYVPKPEPPRTKVPVGGNDVDPGAETRAIWTNAEDAVTGADGKEYKSAQATIWRWREDFQNDFAARMCWMTKSYKECNHPPVAALKTPERLTVHEGESFYLDATGSSDPDGDSLSYLWFQYVDAGTYPGIVSFRPYASNLKRLKVTAPHVEKPEMLHFILKVTDKGTPALTRYRRVIVDILPSHNH
jgi:hypothetical protein